MNKILKIMVAILGGADACFTLVTPIFLSLLIINSVILEQTNQIIILIVGIAATVYRASSFLWIKD